MLSPPGWREVVKLWHTGSMPSPSPRGSAPRASSSLQYSLGHVREWPPSSNSRRSELQNLRAARWIIPSPWFRGVDWEKEA